jgi:pyruvate dehydrogenase E2 component (dihydrolipoamide acetyltransferase)
VGKETEVRLPDIGDFSEVDVIEVLVAPGDRVEEEQSLITLESDKATMEIPSPHAGTVKALKVDKGDKVSEGDVILTMELAGEGAAEGGGERASGEPEPGESESAAGEAEEPSGEAQPRQAEAAPAGGGEETEVRVPDIGDFSEVEVIEVLVAPGDRVEEEQSLITLESDKATMEIPSPHAGTVKALRVDKGDKVSEGDPILVMETEAAAAEPETQEGGEPSEPARGSAAQAEPSRPAPGEKEARQPPVMPRPADMRAIAKGRKPHASPGVRRFARELGVDLTLVEGSGPKGRILKDDVQGFVKKSLSGAAPAQAAGPLQLPAAPEVDFSKYGEITEEPLGRIKRITGERLQRAWLTVPQVTQFDQADITELEAFRKARKAEAEEEGVKLTPLAFLLKACAAALKALPRVNSSLAPDGETLIYKKYVHIGVAVDTPNGLVVPVIRDVDRKGLFQLAGELGEVSRKARDGKLVPGDMQGGTFSISSLGGIGGTAFTPIVNAPEVAILGVARAEMRPVWNGESFEPRLMLPLALSYDHRVVDGAEGARFTTHLAGLLGDIRRLLL